MEERSGPKFAIEKKLTKQKMPGLMKHNGMMSKVDSQLSIQEQLLGPKLARSISTTEPVN